MTNDGMKEVDFTYCLTCKHWSKDEAEEPCHECMNNPTNMNSHRPVRYEADENKVNRS